MADLAYSNQIPSSQPQNIIQGEYGISTDPEAILTTVLGSCVAVCLFDPVARIGGMNHFLLPEGQDRGAEEVMYGVNAMELLINALLKGGASRSGLKAKLFGGAHMVSGLSNIGERNSEFARKFIRDEGFCLVGESLGGVSARRIRFWPVSGKAQQRQMNPLSVLPEVMPKKVTVPAPAADDIELF